MVVFITVRVRIVVIDYDMKPSKHYVRVTVYELHLQCIVLRLLLLLVDHC